LQNINMKLRYRPLRGCETMCWQRGGANQIEAVTF